MTSTSFRGKCPFFKDKEEKALKDIRCKERADKWEATNEVAKLTPEKQQEIITEKPQISHKEVKKIQKQELSAAEKVSHEKDEDKDDEDKAGDKPIVEPLVILSSAEAETIS